MVLVQKCPFFKFFFKQYRPEKVLLRYSRTKKRLSRLAIKTRSLESRKIDIFPKGLTYGFLPKMAIFPTFLYLGNIAHEKFFYDILEQKNAFLGYKKKKFKKSKN